MLKKLLKYYFFLLPLLMEAVQPAVIKEEFVFNQPPFVSCHASTLTATASGRLLCAWFAGTEEGADDVAIWLSSLEKKGWSFPHIVAKVEHVACWNPVLFTMPSKEILLFYKVGRNPQQWSGFLKRSYDEGKNWSKEEGLPAGILGPIKNKPLLLTNGTLLCGSSIESWRRWGCWIDITSDQGFTWRKSTPINVDSQLFGIIQPTLFFAKGGKIKLLARSHQIGAICVAESIDLGNSWSSACPTTLPNPNSGIDAVNLMDGRVILVYNHSTTERYPLNVAVSEDGGDTWQMKLVLEENPGEYSYPRVIQTEEQKIHITNTWNREKIKHVVLDPKCL
jgi:predicted neuraminidase